MIARRIARPKPVCTNVGGERLCRRLDGKACNFGLSAPVPAATMRKLTKRHAKLRPDRSQAGSDHARKTALPAYILDAAPLPGSPAEFSM